MCVPGFVLDSSVAKISPPTPLSLLPVRQVLIGVVLPFDESPSQGSVSTVASNFHALTVRSMNDFMSWSTW